jgi:hypothetical protein
LVYASTTEVGIRPRSETAQPFLAAHSRIAWFVPGRAACGESRMRRSGWGPPEKDPHPRAPRRRPTSTLRCGLSYRDVRLRHHVQRATPEEYEAGLLVRRMQVKLHHWAAADRCRRFPDLFNLVSDPAFCDRCLAAGQHERGSAHTRGRSGHCVLHRRPGRSARVPEPPPGPVEVGAVPAGRGAAGAKLARRDAAPADRVATV